MRVLTVRQPWALHIIQSGKGVENRVRNVAGSYRGPVAIHTALKADEDALRKLPLRAPNGVPRVFDYGVIIGVVDLVGVHHADWCWYDTPNPDVRALRATRDESLAPAAGRHCSPWAQPGHHHIVLGNPRQLFHPIPYRGALGLRTLHPETVDLIGRTGYTIPEKTGATS